jgi:hypothetical protein
LGKRGNKRHEEKKSDTEKITGLGGSDPTFGAFSRPKFCGVAPARPEQLRAVFCPRAYRDVINPEYREETIPINERRKSRWQY